MNCYIVNHTNEIPFLLELKWKVENEGTSGRVAV